MSTIPRAADHPAWGRWQAAALVAGVIGLLLCALGAALNRDHFFRSYLVAFNFWVGISLGCLVILMIQHLTGGAWGFTIRRVLEAGMQTLPVMTVLFTPVACGVGYLYLWAQPDVVAHNAKLQHQQVYLNVPPAVARYLRFEPALAEA